MEGIDLSIENLKEQLNELKQKISQLRKQGLDTKIAVIMMMSVPSKIKMLEITKDYKDLQKIINIINNARAEIDSLEKLTFSPRKS